MDVLRLASTVIIYIVVVGFCLIIGDYLGYKFGRMRLASYTLFSVLALVIIFAIFAVIKSL
jgi:DNA-binding MurR/RpiR family transcriptional regulator